ncbi:hypothetical protein E2C01_021187 [Portunus trituberculatus]|uniref:Uncharacterized protein n=1 Tax=Portunus trituberculatus TaxID=210409 RepID=A0A5B7E3Q1_PORTR|nr:hypothetical protein [Portunus trituberculatus]
MSLHAMKPRFSIDLVVCGSKIKPQTFSHTK